MLLSEEDIVQMTLRISEEFRDRYHREWPRIQEILLSAETGEERLEFARADPETAHLFEKHTAAEREERGRELAMSVAVARAIVFGYGLIYQTLHRT